MFHSQVSIIDSAAVGEVQETFIVSSSPIQCIAAIPEFNDQDPDVLASESLLNIFDVMYIYTNYWFIPL